MVVDRRFGTNFLAIEADQAFVSCDLVVAFVLSDRLGRADTGTSATFDASGGINLHFFSLGPGGYAEQSTIRTEVAMPECVREDEREQEAE